MSIEEIDIPYLDNKLPKFKPNLYPVPNKEHVPRCYFIMIANGCRGSGKTVSCCKMVSMMEKYGYHDPITNDEVKIKTYLFSPTAESNPIFTTLKSLDEERTINDYSDDKLIEIIDEIKEEKKRLKDYREYVQAYKRYEKMSEAQLEKCKDYDFLGILYKYDFVDYRDLEKVDAYVYNIILDDCLANKEAFSAKRANALTKAVLNSRHIGINIILCCQQVKKISKTIRENTDIWVLFKTKNQKVLMEDIYTEFSSLVSPDEFISIFEHATAGSDHDALVFDAKEPDKQNRFKKNFDTILRLK
jgi:hypothetical protein